MVVVTDDNHDADDDKDNICASFYLVDRYHVQVLSNITRDTDNDGRGEDDDEDEDDDMI